MKTLRFLLAGFDFDSATIVALTPPVVKPYVCYPKEVELAEV